MSLQSSPLKPVPVETAHVARAAFPKGNPYLQLRDNFGTIFCDEDFADLFASCGQPAYAPWRLALVTILQFRENLSDRQAAEAVRARIDWKYLLGLELSDPGFDFSVVCEFRARLINGSAEERLLDKLLTQCQQAGLVKAAGRQRTDCTYVLASVRSLARLELLGETLRAALNALAQAAPEWLRGVAPPVWYERYGRRIEESRLPRTQKERQHYVHALGADGFILLDHIAEAAPGLSQLSEVEILSSVWACHYERAPELRLKRAEELPPPGESISSPYDAQARYCSRQGVTWVGYRVHMSETCDTERPRLITHVETTQASVQEVCTLEAIHQGLARRALLPRQHLVDAAYVSGKHLVGSQRDYGVSLIGPALLDRSWQARQPGGYTKDQFEVDWEKKHVRCPEGKTSLYWNEFRLKQQESATRVQFSPKDCQSCSARARCTRSQKKGRQLELKSRAEHEALQAARRSSEAVARIYPLRSGIEATFSQAVRVLGLRQARYRGQVKVHLEHIATAAAINLERTLAWLDGRKPTGTRITRFAALAA